MTNREEQRRLCTKLYLNSFKRCSLVKALKCKKSKTHFLLRTKRYLRFWFIIPLDLLPTWTQHAIRGRHVSPTFPSIESSHFLTPVTISENQCINCLCYSRLTSQSCNGGLYLWSSTEHYCLKGGQSCLKQLLGTWKVKSEPVLVLIQTFSWEHFIFFKSYTQ